MEMIFTKVYISWAWSPVIWSRGAQWKSVFLSSKSPGDKSDLWYRQLGLSTGQWVKSDIAGYYIILSMAVHSAHTAAAAAHHIYHPQWIWQTDRRPSRLKCQILFDCRHSCRGIVCRQRGGHLLIMGDGGHEHGADVTPASATQSTGDSV